MYPILWVYWTCFTFVAKQMFVWLYIIINSNFTTLMLYVTRTFTSFTYFYYLELQFDNFSANTGFESRTGLSSVSLCSPTVAWMVQRHGISLTGYGVWRTSVHVVGCFMRQLRYWKFHSTIGDRAFPVAAAKVWNCLPPSITSSQSLPQFRRALKTELFPRSYGDACHWTPRMNSIAYVTSTLQSSWKTIASLILVYDWLID